MHTQEQKGFHRHTGEIAQDFDRTLCFLCAVAVHYFSAVVGHIHFILRWSCLKTVFTFLCSVCGLM